MDKVGSSTVIRGRGFGFSIEVIVSPICIPLTPETAIISPETTVALASF